MASIRVAGPADLAGILAIDAHARDSARRQAAIREALEQGLARVLDAAGQVVGYGLVHHQFFEHSLVALLYLQPSWRGQGHGPAMLERLVALSVTPRVFTSTNASNAHMQHVLARAGWLRCGSVDHLDPGDPEWIYSLDLEPRT